jgi:hypothetical protein
MAMMAVTPARPQSGILIKRVSPFVAVVALTAVALTVPAPGER